MEIGPIKIILFGEDFPGKTSLLQSSFKAGSDVGTKMTIGVELYAKSIFVDRQEVKLTVWDLGGVSRTRRFKTLIPKFVIGALGGLYLYDVKDYSTFAHVDDWFNIIRNELQNKDKFPIFPILVVGIIADDNKAREVTAEEGMKVAKSLKVDGFIECNPKTGENVEKAFESLTRLILGSLH